jgi:hypothetical protein
MKISTYPLLSSILLGTGLVFGTSLAQSQTIVEYFNGYGDQQVNLFGLGKAGNGWAGAWALNSRPDYRPGTQLTYSGAGYSNAGNLGGANSGVASYELGANNSQSGQIAYRSFAEPLTGTIWISYLAHVDGGSGTAAPDVLMWFNRSVNTQNYFGLRSTWVDATDQSLGYTTGAAIRYANDTSSYVGSYASGEVHLMLARLDITPGGNDTFDMWVNPDLTGGEGGLGTPVFSMSGSNAYGNGLADVGVSFSGFESMLDAIRVSNGFNMVVIPEPSTYAILLGLFALGAGALTRRGARGKA